MNKKRNTEKFLIIGIILAVTILSATYLTLTGFVIESSNPIEYVFEVEVWANSYIEIETQQNIISTQIYLDDGTLIDEYEIEAHLSDLSLSEIKFEDKSLFNLSEIGPGNYSFSASFQGSPNQYIQSSSIEKQIEITESGQVNILETEENKLQKIEEPELNKINETFSIKISELNCLEFEENVIWSSGYGSDSQGSTSYNIWKLNHTCGKTNWNDCSIENVEVETRFIYIAPFETNTQGEGYVKISEPDETICNNPEQGVYKNYLAFETLNDEEIKKNKYCDKNPTAKCREEIVNTYEDISCYGIEIHASQYSIVDVFKIKYRLCQGGSQ